MNTPTTRAVFRPLLKAEGQASRFSLPTPTSRSRRLKWLTSLISSLLLSSLLTLTLAQAATPTPGTVTAWGDNSDGQVTPPAGLNNVTAISAGFGFSLALKSDGTVVGWGSNGFGQATPPAGLNNVIAIAAGSSFSLALKSDGTVVGWGFGGLGQLAFPAGLNNVTAISTTGPHVLALKSDGTVVGWGYGTFGETTPPAGLNNVTAIAAGLYHSLALKSDGTVVSWGTGTGGDLTVPAGLSNVIAIAAGSNHNLALKSDGTVVAWGNNLNGVNNVPAGLNNVIAISTRDFHSLALKSDGTVVAWGNNDAGQSNVPAGLSNVTTISAGEHHSLALVAPPAKQNQTITLSGLPATAVFNTSFTPSATSSAGLPVTIGVSGVCTLSNGTVTMTSGTGTCVVTASQAGNANYNPASTSQTVTAQKASQAITFNVPAFNYYPYPSGNNTFSVGATASSGLPVSFSASGVCSVSGTTVTLSGVGVCVITAAQAGNTNYNPAPSLSRTFQIVPNPTTYALLSLGTANLTSTQTQGPVAALGNSAFLGTNIAYGFSGPNAVTVQGNVSFGNWGNRVNGNVVYSGSLLSRYVTFARGGFVHNSNALPATLKDYALKVSAAWAALSANGTVDYKPWGQIILTGNNQTQNVFNLDGTKLSAANSLVIQTPANVPVILNITGTSDRLQNMGISLQGPASSKIVYNFYQATSLNISSVGVSGTVWAPKATVNFTSASITGSLIAGSLTDSSGGYQSAPFDGVLPAVQ